AQSWLVDRAIDQGADRIIGLARQSHCKPLGGLNRGKTGCACRSATSPIHLSGFIERLVTYNHPKICQLNLMGLISFDAPAKTLDRSLTSSYEFKWGETT